MEQSNGVGKNLVNLPAPIRRAVWRARKEAQRAGICETGFEAHHPDYTRPELVSCVTPKEHRGLPHRY